MNETGHPALTLEAFSAEVELLLRKRGLIGAQGDARVSAAPDTRTVRYYTSLGLLDRPDIVQRQARYGPRHVLQLFAVKALQASGLPLSEVQQRLYGRSDAELRVLGEAVAAEARQTEPAPPAFRPMRELVLAPGCRLVVEDGFEPQDVEALEAKFRAAMAALSRPSGGRRGAGA